MAKRRIAYLAPELPSGSAAFAHEEINHLTQTFFFDLLIAHFIVELAGLFLGDAY